MSSPQGLGVHDMVSGGQHTLVLTGELDLATAPELRAALARLSDEHPTDITPNLSELTFIDTSGLHAVLGVDNLCHRHGYTLTIVPCGEAITACSSRRGVDDLPIRFHADEQGA